MCGIAGIVSTNHKDRIDPEVIHRMCEQLVHRGPDEEGFFVRGGAGLGIRRLSIIDPVGGHQPVSNEDGSVWIVFNGEIYNFLELRPDLENRGHRFSTNSDTEVIVHLYEEMGVNCVQKLRGMFAFALYDENHRSLLIARDRLGKKPLHFARVNGQLLFASELKSILAVAPELATLNYPALVQYLYFGYILDPNTAFTPIQKLSSGHILQFNAGEITIRKYWDLPKYSTWRPTSEEECLEELEHLLAEAVRARLISDVPLGALLSGGTDSSTVVALMARASSKPVKTFSIGFRNAEFNETQYSRLVAERFSTEHHELFLEPDILDTLEKLTSSLEEPFGDSSMLPTYYLCQMARQHVTVALSGDGGDELFAGYDRYRIHFRRRMFEHIPPGLRSWYRERIFSLIPPGTRGRRLSYSLCLPWAERYVDELSFVPAFERETALLSKDFREIIRGSGDPLDLMLVNVRNEPDRDQLSQLLYLDTKTYLCSDILSYVDRMSMAVSLEVRAPLLDHIFVERVTELCPEWKMRGKKQKYIFRKLAERLGVPREVLYRPKKGFALPLVDWIRAAAKDWVTGILLAPETLQRGYFEPRGVRKLLDEHFSGRRNESGNIWRLLIFELWHRNFLEKWLPLTSSRCRATTIALPK